jgi:poly(3-hydroxyalkanoate) synthetase
MINDKKDYKIKYNQYIKCPICEGLFNLIRSNEHINTKKCLYIQSIKDKYKEEEDLLKKSLDNKLLSNEEYNMKLSELTLSSQTEIK